MHRLLPPRLVVITLVLMAIIGHGWPALRPISMPLSLIGLLPLILGLAATARSAALFNRVDTNIVTTRDPDLLVTAGWFAHSRNPMYLGFLLVLVGSALLMGGGSALVGPAAFFPTAQLWYIPFEERRMAATFGEPYRDYCADVRRWM